MKRHVHVGIILATFLLLALGCARSQDQKLAVEQKPPAPQPVSNATAVEKGSLDGKTFAGEIGEKGKSSGDKDSFSFKEGRFRSVGCDQYGFTPSPYTIQQEGEESTFEVVCNSPKEGTMIWKGSVNGNAIDGTTIWTKEGQAPIEYWFKGMLQQ